MNLMCVAVGETYVTRDGLALPCIVTDVDHPNDRVRLDCQGLSLQVSFKYLLSNFKKADALPVGEQMLFDPSITLLYTKCECGVDAVGGNIHSDYCPKYMEVK